MDGIFSGRVIRSRKDQNSQVSYGPIVTPKELGPIDKVINSTIGKVPYEANGAAQIPPDKIQFLGS